MKPFRRFSSCRGKKPQARTLRLESLELRQMFSASSGMAGSDLSDDAVTAGAASSQNGQDFADEIAAAVEAESTITLGPIDNIDVPGRKTVLVPLNGVDSEGQPITYTFSTTNSGVTLSRMAGTKSLRLNITGKDKDGVGFAGALTLRLFEDVAPQTVARIIQLVETGLYTGKEFHRIIDGFMGQAGSNNGPLTIPDEFNSDFTFVSRGLLAMANAGNDTNNAQFFITAIDEINSSNPKLLAGMPQHLNFQHTIFGQLVSGFEVFQKLMQTPVDGPNNSDPIDSVTITSAQIIEDTQNAVLRVTPTAGFTGTATITVRARSSTGETVQQTFTATAVADNRVDPPFLGTVSNRITPGGVPIQFNLTSTSASNGAVTYAIFTPTGGTPANVAININQQTGLVTLTPSASFTGTINLLAAVRLTNGSSAFENYDTQAFTLTVTQGEGVTSPTGLSVMSSSMSGPFEDGGFITSATPTLTVTAPTGSTVQIKRNGTVIATATETTAGSGTYRATLPAGSLAVGANSLTAVATTSSGASPDSTALSVTFAPDYMGGVYTVPGVAGASQTLTFAWTSKNAAFDNEFGYAVVSNASGAIGSVAPTAANYAQALLSSSSRSVIFARGAGAGATKNVTLTGGQFLVFYMIQDNTTATFLAKNPTNVMRGNGNDNAPLAFFSVPAANPDDKKHAQIIADATTGFVQYNWEDLYQLGDGDFNDAAFTVRTSSQTNAAPAGVRAPGSTGNVNVSGTLRPGSLSSPLGDIGVFFVDSPSGAIGSLRPGDSGYAAQALAASNSAVLFPVGTSGTRQVSAPAGKYVAFYTITSGTTANFRSVNSSNSSSGSAIALFSFDDANPDDLNHFRWVTPGSQAANPDLTQLHVNTRFGGGGADFDAFSIDLRVTE